MKSIFKFLINHYFILTIIVMIAFGVRLYKIDNPIADWHSWRQADTAAVARNFYKEGFNPLLPKYDDMVAQRDNITNVQRLRMVEFPIYNSAVYLLYLLNHGVDEKLARLVSILASLGSIIFLYLIVKRLGGVAWGLLSALFLAILPFNIYFSRVTLPEPTLVFFSLGMFYFTYRWIYQNTNLFFALSIFFTASAFLVKPTAIFYLLPLIYVYYLKEKKWWPVPKRYLSWVVLSLTPFILWRIWISNFSVGIPPSNWLFDGDNLRFKPSFWRWIIGDRMGREILGIAGSILFFVGLLVKPWIPGGKVLHLLFLSLFLYIVVFATGNVRHDYYQTLVIPVLAVFTARGFLLLIKGVNGFIPRIWTIPLALLLFFLTIYLTWGEIKGLYQINNGLIVEAGKKADQILPKQAVVVAPYNGDTAFLYQINRPGFAMVPFPISYMVENFHVTHYVSVSYDDKTNWLMKRYAIIEATPQFVILDLTKPNFTDCNCGSHEPS